MANTAGETPDDQRMRVHEMLTLAELLLDQIDDREQAEPWERPADWWTQATTDQDQDDA